MHICQESRFFHVPLLAVHTVLSKFKGSPDQKHFILEINVGNRRIRHKMTEKVQGRSKSDPLLSDIDLKNEMAWM